MNLKSLGLLAIALTAASTTSAWASITRLAAPDKAAVLGQKFDIINRIATIPKCVRDEFINVTKCEPISLADPGQPFQSTAYNSSANLPYYRLVFAASTDGYYLIEALRGGPSPGSDIFLFKVDTPKSKDMPFVIHEVHGPVPHSGGALVFDNSPQSAKLIWCASEDHTAGDLDGVRKAIVDGKMDDVNVDVTVPMPDDQSSPGSLTGPMQALTKSW